MTRPDWCPQDVWEATEAQAKDRADWLVDAVATSTQNPAFLRGEAEEDTWATESILLNGEKAIRIASARAILAERERCAKVCDRERDNAKGNGVPQAAIGAAWCAKAIRAGDTHAN